MKNLSVGIGIIVSSFVFAGNAERQISKKEYVETWRATAVQQMVQYKIPASITMAQAILESANGNSELARKGNNHFGIKCHDWEGQTIYFDDDQKGECFRVYNSVDESYVDHSEFLKKKQRYSNLFVLEMTDYKGWAKGLKEAGYATNPKYPELLTGIIEELKLYELDVLGSPNNEKAPDLIVSSVNTVDVKHSVMTHENRVKYVVARKGDTFYRISKEFGLGLWQLYKYNDFGQRKDVLVEGDIVYIQPKRNKSRNIGSVKLTKEMSLRELSQVEAIKLESLIKLNNISSGDKVLPKGEKVTLR
ncbi:MAG: glucosaminidase domain-containing protein [Flavobacteriia bacterium]